MQTRTSAPSKMERMRARYIAQEDAGEPGMGSSGIGTLSQEKERTRKSCFGS